MNHTMTMKTCTISLALLALAACHEGEAADRKYQKQVARMGCGEAAYTLTSACIKSDDPFELNDCKPQTLQVEGAGAKRTATLPELPPADARRIRAGGGELKNLFVVKWACTTAANGPIATLYYSSGGGSAAYGEVWAHYDRGGRLVDGKSRLTPAEVKAVERSFKKVPSIMPD